MGGLPVIHTGMENLPTWEWADRPV